MHIWHTWSVWVQDIQVKKRQKGGTHQRVDPAHQAWRSDDALQFGAPPLVHFEDLLPHGRETEVQMGSPWVTDLVGELIIEEQCSKRWVSLGLGPSFLAT